MKVKSDHRSEFSNLSKWKEEAWKNQGFNGIRTHDLREKVNCIHENPVLVCDNSYSLKYREIVTDIFPINIS